MSKLDAAMAWFDASFRESTALADARELGHADNSDEAAVSATAGRELVGAVLSLREQERASAHYVRHWRGRAERAEADLAAVREERDRYHSLLSLTESAIMNDSVAITFQSFGQYRDWMLRVMRGKLHNNEADRRVGDNTETKKGN